MNLKTLTKPFKRAIATLGIGNPHTGYDNSEAALMMAGVKPVGIFGDTQITAQLQIAIHKGNIIVAGEFPFKQIYRVYCKHDELEKAKQAINSLKGGERSEIYNFTIANVYEGWSPGPEEKDLEEGKLTFIDFEMESTIFVLAQKDKIKDAHELIILYYNDIFESPYISAERRRQLQSTEWEEGSALVGKILGFTDNDIAWFNGEKYQNPVIKGLMTYTNDWRQTIRQEIMLEDAEDRFSGLKSPENNL